MGFFSPQKVAALGYSTFVCSSQVFKNQHVNENFFFLFYYNVLLDKNYISDQTIGLQIFILGKPLIMFYGRSILCVRSDFSGFKKLP